jgi:uncharacterized protein (DUF433 family)
MDMTNDLIHDRGRGPELVGTRITVYDLLPYFLDPTATESYVCRLYKLTPEQVAAARAYVLNNPTTVLARHLEIEARIAIENPPEVIEQAKKTHALFLRFEEWLTKRKEDEARELAAEAVADNGQSAKFPSFREWMKEQESRPGEGS